MAFLPLYNKPGQTWFSDDIFNRHRFKHDFATILCKLVMCRILFPESKRTTRECLNDFVDTPDFSLDDIYNFSEVLSKEITPLQKSRYETTKNELSLRTGVIYYFDIEKEDTLCRYGKFKEHHPNPIVQTGMFIDADRLPLVSCINPGNTGEQHIEIEKALRMIECKSEKSRQTQQDSRRLIAPDHCANDGELARNTAMRLNMELIEEGKEMDGLNCVATKLKTPYMTYFMSTASVTRSNICSGAPRPSSMPASTCAVRIGYGHTSPSIL